MKSDSERRPETIERLATAVYPSMAMMAGMQLDVFTPLKDGPLTAGQVAAALSIDPARMVPLLYALVATGLLTVDGERFANTPEADHFLVRGRPAFIGMRHHAYQRRWQAMLQAAESIRTGTPQGRWAYASMSSEERDVYYRGLHTETLAAGRDLAAREDFSRFRRLVDVGGGSGGLAIGLALAWPHLSATIVDLPATIPVAQRHVDEAGVSDRVRVIAADIVSEPLSGSYDVALLRGLLPVLAPGQARCALANVSQAIEPGGTIYVVDWILDDTRVAPPELAAYNLVFLSAFDHAQMYTEAEIRAWLLDAGFRDVTRERSAPVWGTDFMRARRPTTR